MDLTRLQQYQLPPGVARAPVLGGPPPDEDYFRLLRPSSTVPGGTTRLFAVPEAYEAGKILVYVSELKLSPNTPTPEYVEVLDPPGIQIASALIPEALDTVRFTYLKFGIYDSFLRFNELPENLPDGQADTFYLQARPFCDEPSPGVIRPYVWAWVCGVRVPFVFIPPRGVVLPFVPNENEILEFFYLPEC